MKAKSVIPNIKYKNANTTIEWLCHAFAFEKHLVVRGEGETITHAQLIFGSVMIMIGSQQDTEYSKWIKHPIDIGGFVTQSPYIVLEENDIDAHYETAKKLGARIVTELRSEEYGGKNYSCFDIEGHLWNFGSYDPWKSESK